MGRGDKKTAKGKRTIGSFGKSRPHKVVKNKQAANAPKLVTEKTAAAEKAPKTPKAPKAAKAKD